MVLDKAKKKYTTVGEYRVEITFDNYRIYPSYEKDYKNNREYIWFLVTKIGEGTLGRFKLEIGELYGRIPARLPRSKILEYVIADQLGVKVSVAREIIRGLIDEGVLERIRVRGRIRYRLKIWKKKVEITIYEAYDETKGVKRMSRGKRQFEIKLRTWVYILDNNIFVDYTGAIDAALVFVTDIFVADGSFPINFFDNTNMEIKVGIDTRVPNVGGLAIVVIDHNYARIILCECDPANKDVIYSLAYRPMINPYTGETIRMGEWYVYVMGWKIGETESRLCKLKMKKCGEEEII